MADPSIPISEPTLARLRELARWAGISLGEALDQAIRQQYDDQFWAAANAGYDALRTDSASWAEVEEERRSMEGTLLDGLDPCERWTEDSNVSPPARESVG